MKMQNYAMQNYVFVPTSVGCREVNSKLNLFNNKGATPFNRTANAGGLSANIKSTMMWCETTKMLLLLTTFLLIFFSACKDTVMIADNQEKDPEEVYYYE